MIDRIILSVDERTYSLLEEQASIQLADSAKMSLQVQGSESEYGVEIKCFRTYPPPPVYEGCAACGSLKVADGVAHYFVVKGEAFGGGQGRLEFEVDDYVGTVIRATADIQVMSYEGSV